ncbi:hypothetical protein OZX61_07455 [Acinetobacter sp. ESL0695]|uniref:hypothetical protein n=1 Tax=Gammaproteobacteria TaxID=1236 RepID=UPI0023F5500E|nr:hypothetical protein [Acinetobacter sp. ESL0695]WEV48126.1 hypothetical protein OZX61_07455 [Acinetobacter sp. ESL0695]
MGIYQTSISQALTAQKQETAKQAIESLFGHWSLDQIAEQIQTPYKLLVDLVVGMPVPENVVCEVLEKLGVVVFTKTEISW